MGQGRKSLFELLNSPLSLIVAGFVLTTLVGSYINKAFHEESLKSNARFEIFKEQLKEAAETQESIILLSSKRFVELGRIYNELEENRLESARKIWKEYFGNNVRDWNYSVKTNKNRLAYLFGDDKVDKDDKVNIAEAFLDENESNVEEPKSLHHIFRVAHKSVLDVIECMKKECKSDEKKKECCECRELDEKKKGCYESEEKKKECYESEEKISLLKVARKRLDTLGTAHDAFSAKLINVLAVKRNELLN